MMSDDTPKVTDFGLAKFTPNYDPEMMTVGIPADFIDLTVAFKNDSEPIDETAKDDSTTTSEDEVDLTAWKIGTPSEDEVVLTEWKKKIGTPSIADEQRLDDVRHFIHEALRQASLDLPRGSRGLVNLTRSRAIMGTPQYMSPEQALGKIAEVGPATDIYSLGAIMYEMLTGRPPFTGQKFQVMAEVIKTPPVPPRQRRDSIDTVLEAICMRCLEKRIKRRYESMGSLAEDLQRFLSGGRVDALGETSPSEPQFHTDEVAQEPSHTDSSRRSTTLQAVATRTKSWWQFWR
jgi:serine/threonine protein kinase